MVSTGSFSVLEKISTSILTLLFYCCFLQLSRAALLSELVSNFPPVFHCLYSSVEQPVLSVSVERIIL
jgi:hypothetical protein